MSLHWHMSFEQVPEACRDNAAARIGQRAIDKNFLNANRQCNRVFISRDITYLGRVQHHHIGMPAYLQLTALM